MKLVYVLLFAVLAYASEKKEVQLRGEIQVGSAIPVMLEDLVAGDTVPTELLNLEVPVQSHNITREELLSWLKVTRAERRELASYRFKIPRSIKVEKIASISRDQIARRAQSRLQHKCTTCEFSIQVKNIPQLGGETNRIEWRDLPLSGPFMVSVTNTEGHNVGWLSGQIRTSRMVVKTNRALQIGETLQAGDLKVELADISYNKDHFTEVQSIVGKKLSRAVGISTVLSSQDIQRNYDVRQGQIIKVISGNETFEVASQATAQDSGVVGDMIRVRNLSNQKVLSGRILERGLVRVE